MTYYKQQLEAVAKAYNEDFAIIAQVWHNEDSPADGFEALATIFNTTADKVQAVADNWLTNHRAKRTKKSPKSASKVMTDTEVAEYRAMLWEDSWKEEMKKNYHLKDEVATLKGKLAATKSTTRPTAWMYVFIAVGVTNLITLFIF